MVAMGRLLQPFEALQEHYTLRVHLQHLNR